MSLQGIRMAAKVIEQMEYAENYLEGLAKRAPNDPSAQLDDKIRSAIRVKSAELQDELGVLLGSEKPNAKPG